MRPRPVLLLNQNYAPLNVCPTPRALSLVDRGKAEVLEYGPAPIAATTRLVGSPSVIRLRAFVRTPPPRLAVTRAGVHLRDGKTCQYCGAQPRLVTLDHVRPVCQGGRFAWTNLVTACGPCNHRKGGRTPEQAGSGSDAGRSSRGRPWRPGSPTTWATDGSTAGSSSCPCLTAPGPSAGDRPTGGRPSRTDDPVAQSIERVLGQSEVGGSIPPRGSQRVVLVGDTGRLTALLLAPSPV
jgi:5-methylcytosine-specific restriction endonuclease McrA